MTSPSLDVFSLRDTVVEEYKRFAVTDAAVESDPSFTTDITEVLTDFRATCQHFLDGLVATFRPVSVKGHDSRGATDFWMRTGNSTRQIFGTDMVEYQRERWS